MPPLALLAPPLALLAPPLALLVPPLELLAPPLWLVFVPPVLPLLPPELALLPPPPPVAPLPPEDVALPPVPAPALAGSSPSDEHPGESSVSSAAHVRGRRTLNPDRCIRREPYHACARNGARATESAHHPTGPHFGPVAIAGPRS
jgi:hypothetical protein